MAVSKLSLDPSNWLVGGADDDDDDYADEVESDAQFMRLS